LFAASRSAIVMLVGCRFGLQTRCALEESGKSAEPWFSRTCRCTASWVSVGTALTLLVIAQPVPALHVSGEDHPQASATPAEVEADVQPAAVTRSIQYAERRFDRGLTFVGHDQQRLIEETLRRLALAHATPGGALASVANLPPKAFDMLKTERRLHRHAYGRTPD
jgi:hypothetical protein